MEANGWRLDFTHAGSVTDYQYERFVLECGPQAKWYGWSAHSSVGTLSTILKGSGEVTVDFGNCWWLDGNVNVYLDSVLMATAPAGAQSVVKSFAFTNGSMLKIKDEGGNAVVGLNSIKFNCDGTLY